MTVGIEQPATTRAWPFGSEPPGARGHSTLLKALGRDNRVGQVVKRALDLTLATTVLVATSPLFLLIAFGLLVHLGRNPFFAHERVGQGGAIFKCLKFRTMRDPRPEEELPLHPAFKEGTEDRTTLPTRWLRRSSLDELPQLLNVLLGQMSVVGPRPIVRKELDVYYGPLAPVLLTVRPGMAGLWMANGRSNVDYPERAFLELKYATKWSLALDMRILLKAVLAVLARRGAL